MDNKEIEDFIEEISFKSSMIFGNSENRHRTDLMKGIIVNIRNEENVMKNSVKLKKEDFNCIFFQAEKTSVRVSSRELSHFIDAENELRDMIGKKKVSYQKEQNLTSLTAYEALEDMCQISMDTLKKTISGKIKVTRTFLYKFTVGLQMSLEEANQYFALNGGKLQYSCLADYICIHALLDNDTIMDFIKEFELHTDSKLAMRERRSK